MEERTEAPRIPSYLHLLKVTLTRAQLQMHQEGKEQ